MVHGGGRRPAKVRSKRCLRRQDRNGKQGERDDQAHQGR